MLLELKWHIANLEWQIEQSFEFGVFKICCPISQQTIRKFGPPSFAISFFFLCSLSHNFSKYYLKLKIKNKTSFQVWPWIFCLPKFKPELRVEKIF